jgi:branched-chain amino acid transport system permease protein
MPGKRFSFSLAWVMSFVLSNQINQLPSPLTGGCKEPRTGMEILIESIISGILIGVSYGVLAAGLALIFGVMKIINFAHAEFAVLAMYFPTYWFLKWWRIDPFISAFIALPIFFVLGYIMHRLLIEKIIGTPEAETSTLIMTMGFSLLISNLILIGWSGAPRIINQPYTMATWSVGNILINRAQSYSSFISLGLIGGMFLLLNKTLIGKAVKAAADDPEGCAYMGINLHFVYAFAFGIGIAVTAAGGCLMATYRPFHPFFGETIIIILFACVILGGMTSITGALLGGLIIGLIQQLSFLVIPIALQNVAVFTVLVLFLYARPQGILGKKGRAV